MTDRISEYEERRLHEKTRKKKDRKKIKYAEKVARVKIKEEARCRNPDCTVGGKVHWHHLVPRSKFGSKDPTQHSIDNACPLCFDCHLKWHQGEPILRRSALSESEVSFIISTAGEVWLDRRYPE